MYCKILVKILILLTYLRLIPAELFFNSFEVSSDNELYTVYNFTKIDGNETNKISSFGHLNKVCVRVLVSLNKKLNRIFKLKLSCVRLI